MAIRNEQARFTFGREMTVSYRELAKVMLLDEIKVTLKDILKKSLEIQVLLFIYQQLFLEDEGELYE